MFPPFRWPHIHQQWQKWKFYFLHLCINSSSNDNKTYVPNYRFDITCSVYYLWYTPSLHLYLVVSLSAWSKHLFWRNQKAKHSCGYIVKLKTPLNGNQICLVRFSFENELFWRRGKRPNGLSIHIVMINAVGIYLYSAEWRWETTDSKQAAKVWLKYKHRPNLGIT